MNITITAIDSVQERINDLIDMKRSVEEMIIRNKDCARRATILIVQCLRISKELRKLCAITKN